MNSPTIAGFITTDNVADGQSIAAVTLRDLFAMAALAGLTAYSSIGPFEEAAHEAWRYADAMMAKR